MAELFSLFAFVFALVASPGPAVISIIASGLTYGFRRAAGLVFGILSGFVLSSLLTGPAIAWLISRIPQLQLPLAAIALGYTMYLALKIWRSHTVAPTALTVDDPNAPIGTSQASALPHATLGYWNGILLMLLNPKVYIVVALVIAQFGDTVTGSDFMRSVKLTAVIVGVAGVTDFSWLLLASRARHWLPSQRVLVAINRTLAVLLVAVVLWAFLR